MIGIDALDEPMTEIAAKAARQACEGRPAEPVDAVRQQVEALPAELAGVARRGLRCSCRGGACSKGIVLARRRCSKDSPALCRAGARVEVTLNGEIWLDSTPAALRALAGTDARVRHRRGRRGHGAAGIQLERRVKRDGGGSQGIADHMGAPARSRSRASLVRAVRGCARAVSGVARGSASSGSRRLEALDRAGHPVVRAAAACSARGTRRPCRSRRR